MWDIVTERTRIPIIHRAAAKSYIQHCLRWDFQAPMFAEFSLPFLKYCHFLEAKNMQVLCQHLHHQCSSKNDSYLCNSLIKLCRQCTYALITILSKGNVQFTMIVLLFFLICERGKTLCDLPISPPAFTPFCF